MSVIAYNLADTERNLLGHIIPDKNHYILIVSGDTCWHRHQTIGIYIHVILPYHGVGMRLEFRDTEFFFVLFPSVVLYLDGNIDKFLGYVAHLLPELVIGHSRVGQCEFGTDVVVEELLELGIVGCGIARVQLCIGCQRSCNHQYRQ